VVEFCEANGAVGVLIALISKSVQFELSRYSNIEKVVQDNDLSETLMLDFILRYTSNQKAWLELVLLSTSPHNSENLLIRFASLFQRLFESFGCLPPDKHLTLSENVDLVLDIIFSALLGQFSNDSSKVRKAIVICLVELKFSLLKNHTLSGIDFEEQIGSKLNDGQRRLVSIYFERKQIENVTGV